MPDRRDFIRYTAMAALAASTPIGSYAARDKHIAKRQIPGTDESLAVVGLGNSRSFFEDLSVAGKLVDILLEHGAGYMDVSASIRFNVANVTREKKASESLFFGNYLDPGELETMSKEARTWAQWQGKPALDLVHTSNLSGYRSKIDHYSRLKEEDLVRYTGIARIGANVFPAIMKLIEEGLVDFVQVNYSILEPEAAQRLLPMAMDHGVAVLINRPFINGKYFDIVRGKALPEWTAEFDCHSWAQFSLKYILAHPAVHCVLTETSKPKHALDNLQAGFGRLPDSATQTRMARVIRDLIQEN